MIYLTKIFYIINGRRTRLQRYENNPELYNVPEVERLLNKNIDINERIEIMTQIIKGNLKYLYDSVPERIRKRSKLWYDGANAIAKDSAGTAFLAFESEL